MDKEGWLKFHRKIMRNPIWLRDRTAWHLFETLMMLVDHKTGIWQGGRMQLTTYSGINPNTVYNALKRLQLAKMITLSANTRYSTISICKWNEYQGTVNTKRQQPVNNGSTTNQHSIKKLEAKASNKELKNSNLILEKEQQRASLATVRKVREQLTAKGIIKKGVMT